MEKNTPEVDAIFGDFYHESMDNLAIFFFHFDFIVNIFKKECYYAKTFISMGENWIGVGRYSY